MTDVRRLDSLEKTVADTRRAQEDSASTVLARLGTHSHPANATVYTAYKSSDTTRISTTTETADPDLTLLPSSSFIFWKLECVFAYNSSATADFKFNISGPGIMTLQATHLNAADAVTISSLTSPGAPAVPAGGSGADRVIKIEGMVYTTGSPVALTWAQNTLTASNTIVRGFGYLMLTAIL